MPKSNFNLAALYKGNGRSKFGAQRTIYGGQTFASKKEAAYAAELDLRVRARDIISWRAQIPFELAVNGKKIARYIADFEITHKDGRQEVVETKGFWTPEAKLKRKLFEALYPAIWYTVV